MARREFPKLRKEIGTMLRDTEKDMDELGPSRGNESEQRVYLSHIADKFQGLVRAGLEARYYHHEAFDADFSLKLATLMALLAGHFNEEFGGKGALLHFENTEFGSEENGDDHSGDKDARESSTARTSGEMLRCASQNLNAESFPELDGIISDEYDVDPPRGGIMKWITDIYVRSRGMELGNYSDAVQASAWREQSSKWHVLSHAFVSRAIMAVQQFITLALRHTCPDTGPREALWSCIQGEVLKRYQNSTGFLDYLLSVERDINPFTLNKHFNRARQEAHADRTADHILSTFAGPEQEAGDNAAITIGQIRNSIRDRSNVQDVAEQLHDGLRSYYEVAQNRFVDNVCRLVVQSHLLSGPNSPLGVLNQKWIMELSAEQLKSIAGESPIVKEKRINLTRKIEDLKEAKKILQF